MEADNVRAFAAVVAIGLAVGGTDIVSRYRDAPFRAITTAPAMLYLFINAIAAFAALLISQKFDWKFGGETPDQILWRQVLVAGFGAMALFRTSLFLTTVGEGENDEIDIGPSSVLKSFLGAADRGVDRARASQSANEANRIMAGVIFDRAVEELPAQVSVLLQNESSEERAAFGEQVKALKEQAKNMSNTASVAQLGLLCMRFAGPEVVKAAVDSLGDSIKDPASVAAARVDAVHKVGPYIIQRAAS